MVVTESSKPLEADWVLWASRTVEEAFCRESRKRKLQHSRKISWIRTQLLPPQEINLSRETTVVVFLVLAVAAILQ